MPFDNPTDNPAFTVPAVETDEVLSGLLRARANVARGWCQERIKDSAGRVCLAGAFANALMTEEVGAVALRYVRAALPDWAEGSIVSFNDAPGTTQDDVLAAYDSAIDARRAAIVSKAA